MVNYLNYENNLDRKVIRTYISQALISLGGLILYILIRKAENSFYTVFLFTE
jgi:hypothetical protein